MFPLFTRPDWKYEFLQGLLLALSGVLVLVRPEALVLALAMLFGAGLVVTGVLACVHAWRDDERPSTGPRTLVWTRLWSRPMGRRVL